MAYSHSGADKQRELNDNDYRAYLITRNQAPIVYHSRDMQIRRLCVYARATVGRIDGFLHWMIEAIAASKMRRLQRELALRSVRYPDEAGNGGKRSSHKRLPNAD